MSGKWQPEDFRDSFKDEVMKLVHEKVETGDIETVTQPEESDGLQGGAQILDLTELLQRSLKKGGGKEEGEKIPGRKSAKAGPDRAEAPGKGTHKRRA
jgi:DNA end-binding protein Ku